MATPCEVGQEDPVEGFTPSQEKQLRSKKKLQPNMTEEDKWFQVYTILFPEDDPQDAPSPCKLDMFKQLR